MGFGEYVIEHIVYLSSGETTIPETQTFVRRAEAFNAFEDAIEGRSEVDSMPSESIVLSQVVADNAMREIRRKDGLEVI